MKCLQALGIRFDQKDDELILGMEGAHQRRRIVHVNGDQTGQAFTAALINAIKTRVNILEETIAYSLIKKDQRVIGVKTNKGTIFAKTTVLATGGLGQLYSYTSNVQEATGDGYALAYRTGATLKDMEFVQFHPTLFISNNESQGLISEAVRGEGGMLINEEGHKIMSCHPEADLAPRDVVSRAIYRAIQKGEHVYLDCRGIQNITKRFPGLTKRAKKVGIDLTTTPVQVSPGAHFCSGGVEVNVFGQTSLNGLYAVGEVACTGVHGANRLASNSLLEGFVFAEKVSEAVKRESKQKKLVEIALESLKTTTKKRIPSKVAIQQKLMDYAGIERSFIGLRTLKNWLAPYIEEALVVFDEEDVDYFERKNMIVTASLIVEGALKRTESRGGHFRSDFPEQDQRWLKKYVKHEINRKFQNSKTEVI